MRGPEREGRDPKNGSLGGREGRDGGVADNSARTWLLDGRRWGGGGRGHGAAVGEGQILGEHEY